MSVNDTSSFRDPSGYIVHYKGELYRKINRCYESDYKLLKNSGLLKYLTEQNLLIPHVEVNIEELYDEKTFLVICPKYLQFISYPYEWCFSQLKDAALLTLKVQKIALEFGMILKDASAYNIQFLDGKPILIDTLSFEKYHNGQLWSGYQQFCRHFLAPLCLMTYVDARLNQLLKSFIDGIPMDLCSSLLPFRTKFNIHLYSHIHLHAKFQKKYSKKLKKVRETNISKFSISSIIDSIESAITGLPSPNIESKWSNYYQDTNYSAEALADKIQIVTKFFQGINPEIVWDLGSNTGELFRAKMDNGSLWISIDNDFGVIEKNYKSINEKRETNNLPLLLDIANPSPAIGWANKERLSLNDRKNPDLIIALALVHHICIGNNIPLNRVASYFSDLTKNLIIEFIPKRDSQVKKLLLNREDIFSEYSLENFEIEFSKYFILIEKEKIHNSERFLYKMLKR